MRPSLLDGRPVQGLDPANRATQYGDGVFRTMLVSHGLVWLLNDQLDKLLHDARAIGLNPPPRDSLEELLVGEASGAGEGIIRLSLIAPPGPRGYARTAGDAHCQSLLQHAPLPDQLAQRHQQGVSVQGLDFALGSQPRLAGIKHLNRLEQVLARQMLDPGHAEGLVRHPRGGWLSGVMSNLFWYADGCWQTPVLNDCGVSGVLRDRLLKTLPVHSRARVSDPASSGQLAEADMIVLCNSVIGLWPVRTWAPVDAPVRHWNSTQIQDFAPLQDLRHSLRYPLTHDLV